MSRVATRGTSFGDLGSHPGRILFSTPSIQLGTTLPAGTFPLLEGVSATTGKFDNTFEIIHESSDMTCLLIPLGIVSMDWLSNQDDRHIIVWRKSKPASQL
jgi:hypothetical protein